MAQEAMFDIILCKASPFARDWDQVLQSNKIKLTVYEAITLTDKEYNSAVVKYKEDRRAVVDKIREEGKMKWSNKEELDEYIRMNSF